MAIHTININGMIICIDPFQTHQTMSESHDSIPIKMIFICNGFLGRVINLHDSSKCILVFSNTNIFLCLLSLSFCVSLFVFPFLNILPIFNPYFPLTPPPFFVSLSNSFFFHLHSEYQDCIVLLYEKHIQLQCKYRDFLCFFFLA